MRTIVSLLAMSFVLVQSSSAQEKVVSGGDSLTGIYKTYFPYYLSFYGSYDYPNPVLGEGGSNTSKGGIGSSAFLGQSDPYVDFRANVIAAQPDVVLFMLGINEAFGDAGSYWNDYTFTHYKENVATIFQSFATQSFKVVVGSITPDNDEVAAAYRGITNQYTNQRVDQYNAWLKEEAHNYGFLYVDTNTMMRQVPNWENTMFIADGLHYNFTGASFVCRAFAQATDLLTQENAIVNTNIIVGDLSAQNILVKNESVLTADSISANSLAIGAGSYQIPEPCKIAMLFGGLLIFWQPFSRKN